VLLLVTQACWAEVSRRAAVAAAAAQAVPDER